MNVVSEPMTVILMRGIPGSGKTKFTPQLAHDHTLVVSADDYFVQGGQYKYDRKYQGQAHGSCFHGFMMAMLNGGFREVIVDNTNIELQHMTPYIAVAEEFGHTVEIHQMYTDLDVCIQRQTHDVPIEQILRMWSHLIDTPVPAYMAPTTVHRGD